MNKKKFYIGWEKCRVYENLTIKRCFKCQEYYHKSDECVNEVSCEVCSEKHESKNCSKQVNKCKNCILANNKYKTSHDINHKASDPECASTKYHLSLLKSRINYET